MLGWPACKIWSPTDNPFPRYKLWISAHSALSMGVEKDAIGEDKAFTHVGKILHNHNAMLGWPACKIWSPTDNPFPRYKLWISAHSALSMVWRLVLMRRRMLLVTKTADWGVGMQAKTKSPKGLEQGSQWAFSSFAIRNPDDSCATVCTCAGTTRNSYFSSQPFRL